MKSLMTSFVWLVVAIIIDSKRAFSSSLDVLGGAIVLRTMWCWWCWWVYRQSKFVKHMIFLMPKHYGGFTKMKLKSFHESFRQDLQDPLFVIGYLQDCLEEEGTELFISALKDVVNAALLIREIHRQQEDLLKNFIGNQNPTFFEVFQVLRFLELDFRLQLLAHNNSSAIRQIALA